MGFLDSIKSFFKGLFGGSNNNGVGKGKKETKTFTFQSVPANVEELKALPEASLDTAFKTAALTVLALCRYKDDKDATFAMLDFLNGPDTVSPYTKQFIRDRLMENEHIPFSFFKGSSVSNDYTPSQPLTIDVMATPYSFDEENWATMWVQSSGADSPRSIKLRKKPSTGEWFFTEIQCLGTIRTPVSKDKWA